MKDGACTDDAAQPDDGVFDNGVWQYAAVVDDGVVNLGTVDFGAGQKARAAENGRSHVEEVEARQFAGDVEVGFEKRADGADVFPIALKYRGEYAHFVDGLGDDVLAEIGHRIVEKFLDYIPTEHVDAHRGEKEFAVPFNAEPRIPFNRQLQGVLNSGIGCLLNEPRDAALGVDLQDAKSGNVATRHGNRRDSNIGFRLGMQIDDSTEVHPIQLVAAENEQVIPIMIHKMDHVFADGISGALVPGSICVGLFGC